MNIKKTVIINRAVPGSGKTTISNSIIQTLKKYDLDITIHSTDEYFMVNGKYIFSLDKLNSFHHENMESFRQSLEEDKLIVICDNTNISPWQTKPYTDMAREYGCQIICITFDPREIEKHVESQIVTQEKPHAHGVPENIILQMIDEYFLFDNLLDKNSKIDPTKQLDYKWNDVKIRKEPTGLPSKYFDIDYVIRILPNEYQEAKLNIGEWLMEIINGE